MGDSPNKDGSRSRVLCMHGAAEPGVFQILNPKP